MPAPTPMPEQEQEEPPQGGLYPITPEEMNKLWQLIQHANELARVRAMNELLASAHQNSYGLQPH